MLVNIDNHTLNIYIIIFIQQLIASGTHLVAKSVSQHVDPVILTFLRGVISSAALSILFFIKEKRIKVTSQDIPSLLLLSLIGIPINQFLYLYGIKYTIASNGALLYAMTPVFVLLLSRWIVQERMTVQKIIGVAIAFIGVSIVIFEKGIDFSSEYFFGNVLILIAVIAWAFYAVLGKKMITRYGSFHISALTMIFGAILFSPFGIYVSIGYDFSTIALPEISALLYLALGTSVVGYVLWYYAIGKIETTKVAVFQNMQPVLTTILAVILLDQPITSMFVIGGVITLVGVWITQRRDIFISRKVKTTV